MRKQNKLFLWPVYFDSTKTRNDGRRVPKKLAVPTPKMEELERAAKRLSLQPETVSDATHPNSPWKTSGLVIVPKTEPKVKTIKKVATELCALRR